MNPAKAKSITKYIEDNLEVAKSLDKALYFIKKQLNENENNLPVFRKLGLTNLLFRVLNSKEERVQKWALSIFASCLIDKNYRQEVSMHENGILKFFEIFQMTKCKSLKSRVCKVIGQQCHHEESCNAFHNLNVVKYVLTYLDAEAELNEEKEIAVRTLRYLSKKAFHHYTFLKERGFEVVYSRGLSSDNENLKKESLKLFYQIHTSITASYSYQHLLSDDRCIRYFVNAFVVRDDCDKSMIFKIFLSMFWRHASSKSYQEYYMNCIVLDELCMADLPNMIISELKEKNDEAQLSQDEIKLVLTLCKFIELGKQWKQFSLNVLPSYHERVWMKFLDQSNVSLLISLISSQKQNLTLLQALLRGLMGLEYLHYSKVIILSSCMEKRLLPLLAELFDVALKETCDDSSFSETDVSSITEKDCHHFLTKFPTEKRKSFSKEVSKELLEMVEQVPARTSNNEIRRTSISTSPPSTLSIKKINNIKFRTGIKVAKRRDDDNKRLCINCPDTSPSKQDPDPDPHSSSPLKECYFSVIEESHDRFKKNGDVIKKEVLDWLNVLECIIRLLYQVVIVTQNISPFCRQFLMKVYHYICKSPIVHPSALKLLTAIARNSTSIQYILDITFISQLSVDLKEKARDNCAQCALIKDGVNDYILQCRSFFNHHHQYGSSEVTNRLQPWKPDIIKRSCIVSVSHVVKCPGLLNSFYINLKGLECLLQILRHPDRNQLRMQTYAIASLCDISRNLKNEFDLKVKVACLYCTNNISSLCFLEYVKERETKKHILTKEIETKKHILTLTNRKTKDSHSMENCQIEKEEEKNFSFLQNEKVLKVNKGKLALKNEVFNAKLQGSFTEACEDFMLLKDEVEFSAMEMLIHFIYGCNCSVFFNEDINVYIELLYLGDMYFLPELQIMAIHHLSELLDCDNVFPLIERLINYVNKDLIQHLICSLMSRNTNFYEKEKWINHILNSSFRDTFAEYVIEGFTKLFESTSIHCNCDIYRSY